MQFQLVIQFEAASIEDFDRLIQVEEELSARLSRVACVDGHDFGQGEFNGFVLTDHVKEAFLLVQEVLPIKMSYQAAYRDLQTDADYIVLWSTTSEKFEIA